jgi:phosphoglycerol transferase
MKIHKHHIVFALFGTFVILVAMTWSMPPSVFPDEYIHSRSAIWLPFNEAKITGYLYYLVYWLTGLFGDNYLQAARMINAFFHVAGCYILFLTASKLIESRFAAIISLSVAIGPLATYVAYFMPESMYFFFFWAFILLVVRIDQESRFSFTEMTIVGASFGLLWLVKPHAAFILPIYPLYLIIRNGSRSIAPIMTFAAASIIVKFAVSIALAGTDGLSWFGAGYSEHGETAATNITMISQEYMSIATNLIGHLATLASILGLSVVVVISRMTSIHKPDKVSLGLFAILLTTLMVAVVSVFAISVHIFEDNSAHRLYLRYYGFAIPLFLIAVFDGETSVWDHAKRPAVAILAAVVSVMSLAPAYYFLSRNTFYPFKIIRTDIPEIALLASVTTAFYFAAFLGMCTIFLWLFKERLGVLVYGYVTLPVVAVLMFIGNANFVISSNVEHEGIIAGRILRDHIETTDHDVVLVAGSNRFKNDQVRMYARSGCTGAALVQLTNVVPDSLVDSNIKWILTPDSLGAPSGFKLELSEGRVLLYKREESNY